MKAEIIPGISGGVSGQKYTAIGKKVMIEKRDHIAENYYDYVDEWHLGFKIRPGNWIPACVEISKRSIKLRLYSDLS